MKATAIYIDCDGVLTDGTLSIDHHGEKMFKTFHTRDVRAIRELVSHGFEVTIVTADDWPGVFRFAEKVGAEVLVKREKGDLPQPYLAIGDDAWDVPMLKRAEKAFAPADADDSVLQVEGIVVLFAAGGRGVVAEVARRILE